MKTNLSIIFIFVVICAILGALLWPYTINAWLAFFGKPTAVVWWHGVLLGFVPGIGQAAIPLAAVTWILMLFL